MAIPRGKIKPNRDLESVRAITREDLPRLLGPRDKSTSMPQRLRDSHHTIARLLAMGHHLQLVADMTGYSVNRISQLSLSPAMIELVAHYRGKIDEIWDTSIDAYASLAIRNMIAAERQISDKLDEADADGETLPIRELVAISRDAADRFGYSKKQTNINVNTDFAADLEKAIARSGKQIDGVANGPRLVPRLAEPGPIASQAPSLSVSNPTPAGAPVQSLFRRRA